MTHHYLVALGSNRRHGRHGPPQRVVAAALNKLGGIAAPILRSKPIGPSRRFYANTVALIASPLGPPELLHQLKAMERSFGRRAGQRWGERILDLDIILWSGGIWSDPRLVIPHASFRVRDFVLIPAARIAPDWRDPVSGLRIRHLKARLDRLRRDE